MDRNIKPVTDKNELPLNFNRTSSGLSGKFINGTKEYFSHIKLFSRNARLFLIGIFLTSINFHVFQLLLNLYLKDLDYAEGDIGFIISSRAIGATIMAIPAALILSRVKLKPILIGCSILFAIFSFFISSSEEYFLLIVFSILNGMAFAFYRVSAGPFFMRNSTIKERTYLFSFNFGIMILAGMTGSLFSGKAVTLLQDFTNDIIMGYRFTLYGAICVGLLGVIPFFMIKPNDPTKEEKKLSFNIRQLKVRGKLYFKIGICNYLIGMGAGLIIPFLNLYFRDRFNLEADTIGYFYSFVSLAMVAGALAGPVLAKKYGLVRTVVITQLASIPFMLILSYSFILPLAFIAFVLRAGLMNLGVPIVNNLSMELSDKQEQGLVNAILMIAWTSSWMISSAIGGSLIEKYGYTVTMNITILLYIVSTVIFWLFFKNTETKTESQPGWVINRDNY